MVDGHSPLAPKYNHHRACFLFRDLCIEQHGIGPTGTAWRYYVDWAQTFVGPNRDLRRRPTKARLDRAQRILDAARPYLARRGPARAFVALQYGREKSGRSVPRSAFERRDRPIASALSNAQALRAYVALYRHRRRPQDLETARGLLRLFRTDVHEGGVRTHGPVGEHPLLYSFDRDSRVVNSFLVSMVALVETALDPALGDEDARPAGEAYGAAYPELRAEYEASLRCGRIAAYNVLVDGTELRADMRENIDHVEASIAALADLRAALLRAARPAQPDGRPGQWDRLPPEWETQVAELTAMQEELQRSRDRIGVLLHVEDRILHKPCTDRLVWEPEEEPV
jgi:hypothetical protein